MIFVTVGTQGPFDRLVRTVDEWAGARGTTGVFAQTGPSDYCPKHISAEPFISPAEFARRVASAGLVIAHAGMGSIITALEQGKQIIVMPRRADLGEHRNDHQVATAKRFAEQGRILAAFDEQELLDKLDRLRTLNTAGPLIAEPSSELIATIRIFIETGRIVIGRSDARG
jgi:UDP-N-acetylglucosamine transferase subunit ALG13